MNVMWIDASFGLASAMIGLGVGWAWARRVTVRGLARQRRVQVRLTEAAIVQLAEIASRLAADVDEHQTRVENILAELRQPRHEDSKVVVAAIAKLIEANRQLRGRLERQRIQLMEQADRLRRQAIELRTDALTRLLNRWAFEEELQRRDAEFRRRGHSVAVCLWDLDHFKRLNDAAGHFAGDEALKHVAAVLRESMRQEDVVARVGGEEFAVVLPSTDVRSACEAAERARCKLAATPFRYQGRELSVTASVGVAQVLGNEHSDRTLRRADDALYAAKNAGRNRVFWHDGKTAHAFGTSESSLPLAEGIATAHDASPAVATATTRDDEQLHSVEEEVMQAVTDLTHEAAAAAARGANKPAADAPASDLREVVAAGPGKIELLDRSAFCQLVRSRLAEWQRGGPSLAVAMFARDALSTTGVRTTSSDDAALTRLAAGLVAQLREMDIVARYAPHCLAVLLPGIAAAALQRVTSRLVRGLVNGNAAGLASDGLAFGICEATRGDDLVRLLTRAESALRAALAAEGAVRGHYHNGRWVEAVVLGSADDLGAAR